MQEKQWGGGNMSWRVRRTHDASLSLAACDRMCLFGISCSPHKPHGMEHLGPTGLLLAPNSTTEQHVPFSTLRLHALAGGREMPV